MSVMPRAYLKVRLRLCGQLGVLLPYFFEDRPGRRPTIGTPPRMRTVDGVVHDVVTGSA